MKKLPTVSVVIPCFNSEKTIVRALNSIANQTLLPSEVIIVDDASSDSSVEVITTWAKDNDIHLRLICLDKNSGPGKARNVGWDNASSSYIAFLDSDDEWLPSKLCCQVALMEKTHYFMSGHNFQYRKENGSKGDKVDEITFKSILSRNRFVTPSVMIRREVSLRFPEDRNYMEDHFLWIKIIKNYGKAAKLEKALVILHKPLFGSSGLSGDFIKMEKFELNNYWVLFKERDIGFLAFLLLSFYSILKFTRRVLVYLLRKIKNE